MPRVSAVLAWVVLLLAVACVTSSTSPDDAGADPVLSADESDTASHGHSGVSPVQLAAQFADSVFDFDPTIDAAKTAADNARAILTHITASLGGDANTGPKCGSVTFAQPATVTVAFAAPPGCTLVKGLTVSGTAVAVVAQSGPTTTVTLTFKALIVNTVDLDGEVSFATTNGTSFVTSGTLTSGGRKLTLTSLTIAGAAGSMTVSGGVTFSGAAGTTALTFKQVVWKIGDCYPNDGAVTAKKGLITTTMTFSSTTPSTGLVVVTVGRKKTTQALPPYGKCGSKDAG